MFTLPKLPYAYDALEPYIDTKTMEIHYTKHHQAYVDNLNKAVEKDAKIQSFSLEKLITHLQDVPESIRTVVRNNGGGHFNHTFFWQLMKKNGGGDPRGMIGTAISKQFGSLSVFQERFNAAAKSVFGSGWAWLCLNEQGTLEIITTANQDSPMMQGLSPIMGLDVWEHAYYLLYQNRRPDYINAWWHVLNWGQIEEQYQSLIK